MAGSRTLRRGALAGLLAIAALISSGCSWADLPRYGWPESASKQGAELQYLWSAAFTAALVVGVVVWGLMFWCFIAYRKRRNSPLYPKQTRENLPIEMVYTAIPFVLITALFYFGTTAEEYALKLDPNPDVTVDVTAFKWNWEFAYQDTEAPGGGPVTTLGTVDEIPVLILPNEKITEYVLESRDVVHAFWVPAYDFKRDVFPYPEQNNSANRFQTTLEREGAWVGRCAELCGTYHAAMNFEVRSVPSYIYDAYIDLREQVNPETGEGYTNAEALSRLGDEFDECGELCSPTATTTYPMQTNRTARVPAEVPENVTGLK